jgi:FkbM family methyltransferase
MYLIRRILYYLLSLFTVVRGVRNWPAFFRLGNRRGESVILTLRDGTRYAVPSLLDAWIVKETNLDRDYERHGAVIQDGWNVVDIGAGLGEFTVFAARRAPHGRIFAYEPVPDSLALLEQNLKLNRIWNVEVHPTAVSDKNGTLMLDVSSGRLVQCRTIAGVNMGGSQIAVRSVTLSDVLAGLPGGVCDFLKMDCEGAEYGILLHLNEHSIPRIRRICLEYHEWAAPFSHRDLVRLFERKGWRVRVDPSKVRRELGFLYATAPSVQ